MVASYSVLHYVCTCDSCGKTQEVVKSEKNYNQAQAVRSLHWSFSRNGKKVECDKCRRYNYFDPYRYL